MSRRKKRKLKNERAMWLYGCPHCGARVGERCRKPDGSVSSALHARRVAKYKQFHFVPKDKRRGSVRNPLSGGGVETNRRRH